MITRNDLSGGGAAHILVCLLLAAVTQAAGQAPQAAGTVHFDQPSQAVTGFGISEAFGQAAALEKLPEPARSEVLELLFGHEKGAALSVVRLGIGTDANLEPEPPQKPSSRPHYTFDGSDGGQVWFAQQARRFGVTQFTATAWSGPPFMKTNQQLIGGSLCGLTDAVCASGNWAHAFADYLLTSVRFYSKAGIDISSLGFLNEPDLHVSYASMLFTPQQAVEFLHTLGPLARKQTPHLQLVCCEASNWNKGKLYLAALQADPEANRYIQIDTAHEYGSHAIEPLPTSRPVWMTEWSSGSDRFQPAWDCNNCIWGSDGMYLANDLIQAFAHGNVNTYIYWWGAGPGPATLIRLDPETGSYTVAKRFYALAGLSRFVQPGARRVGSETSEAGLQIVAFRNPDGSSVLCVLNQGSEAVHTSVTLTGLAATSVPQAYVTDALRSLHAEPVAIVNGAQLDLKLPRRSLTTVVFSGPH